MRRFEEWTVAYRERQEDTNLLNNKTSEFKIIKNTWRYWCADPHLIEENGRTYIFAELYDRILRRGVIGYCEILGKSCTEWKVALKMPWHLSYPHLLRYQDNIYMIPESYVVGEISLYKAISFPGKWKRIAVLKADCTAVDSTVFFANNSYWMQTLQFVNKEPQLVLYEFVNGEMGNSFQVLAKNDEQVRPAGNLFLYGNYLLRPAQDTAESYGCALNIYQITELSHNSYKEELVEKIFPSDICCDSSNEFYGIHTYNFNEKYEVIDLKEYRRDMLFYVMRPIWFVWRRVRKWIERKQ